MSFIVSFDDYTPPIRFDNEPWTSAVIEESDAVDGTWASIDTKVLTPDSDPSQPSSRSFTTQNGTAAEQWYRVTFHDDDGNQSLPSVAIQNRDITAYATVNDLAEILHLTRSVRENEAALTRVLEAATAEIDSELGRSAAFDTVPALAAEVCLERAVEHWQQMKSPFGVLGLGAESGPTLTATDSWNRHANKLSPLKETWGIA